MMQEINRLLISQDMRVTAWTIVAFVVVYFLTIFIKNFYELFGFAPSKCWLDAFYLWTLVTGIFVSRNIIFLLVGLVALFIIGRTFEPLWGRYPFFRFIVVEGMAVNLGITIIISLLYLFGATSLIRSDFSGVGPLIFSSIVALKLHYPTRPVVSSIPALQWFTYNDLPFCLLILSIPFIFVEYLRFIFFDAFVSLFVAWGYLRFWQLEEEITPLPSIDVEANNNEAHVNLMDDFSFSSLFPSPIRPLLTMPASLIRKIEDWIHRRHRLQNAPATEIGVTNIETQLDGVANAPAAVPIIDTAQLDNPQTNQDEVPLLLPTNTSLSEPSLTSEFTSTSSEDFKLGLSLLNAQEQGLPSSSSDALLEN
ncbi:putative Eukaryotic integral membrane protein (DUF1751) [Monocercomonoides exilis]|uniref:putative Eukaryotic integral membrane protein (DUF1751) n=1 Tax=Monocercomonoides exilis TaxID=2049356 RepID=UPI003559766A|nr:putative Eukaryotic integral membrane protein (DUF1751) [Monocercomonoides exilis]|eukprot:MONOS_13238.1-p1 / transcript=MONOS_13238.1 / gene=MONOS_13238 / organism=Monocercomonoides_exilis_PA203 / gene_product=unspecified product / transcript_product=unspecified product / location=Mono_scaffold00796:734-2018(+) / protein_length=365 / sequence_SO=supercontig / SO=protein_coding / is_pseudo=false